MSRRGSARRRRRGRGKPVGAAPQPVLVELPPLSAAGFIAQLRRGALAGASVPGASLKSAALEGVGRAELVGGVVQLAAQPSAKATAVLLSLEARLQAEVAKLSNARPPGVRAAHTEPQVLAAPLLRIGPYVLLRPALVLTDEPRHPGMTPARGETFGVERLLLVVEVIRNRSIAHQRLAYYAAAAVREAWLIDLQAAYTEVYRSPWAGLYRSRTLWYPGEAVPISTVPGLAVVALTGSG